MRAGEARLGECVELIDAAAQGRVDLGAGACAGPVERLPSRPGHGPSLRMLTNYCSPELAALIRELRTANHPFCPDTLTTETTITFYGHEAHLVEQMQEPITLGPKVQSETDYALPDETSPETPSNADGVALPAGPGARRVVESGPGSGSEAGSRGGDG